MSRATRFKRSIGIGTKPPANLPVEYMQDHMNGDLSPALASPPLQYASEVSGFVRAEEKRKLETCAFPIRLPCIYGIHSG